MCLLSSLTWYALAFLYIPWYWLIPWYYIFFFSDLVPGICRNFRLAFHYIHNFLLYFMVYSITKNILGVSWYCLAFPFTPGYFLHYLVFYVFPCISRNFLNLLVFLWLHVIAWYSLVFPNISFYSLVLYYLVFYAFPGIPGYCLNSIIFLLLHGIVCYSLIYNCISWFSLVFPNIPVYSLVFCVLYGPLGVAWYSWVFP